ncbi:MAG: ribose-phosphate pyrophosphokinase [Clostridia bacterium]|nr:ribose-phosphate pyrophosphokinase [Clostridia bacterium]
MEDIKIFACNSAEKFTKEICENLGIELGKKDSFKFANDNTFVQLKETVREKDVYIVQTTQPPVNERMMELLITIEAAKRAGAKRITAVLPYFIYSRSDKKDQSRVPVTAKLMATILEAAGVNHVLTCDLHNPAIQAYFNIICDRVTAKHLLAKYFKEKKLKNIVVVATDAGSSKKAYKYSKFFECPLALIDKRRESNNDNAVATNIIGDIKGRTAIIFDDEISTAGTLVEAAQILKDHGAKEIYAGATHGVLVGPAIERIEKSAIKELVVTNTIPIEPEKMIDKIKIVSIAPLFAEAIKRLNEAKPLGDLFEYDK